MNVEILHGDCRETLKTLPEGSVNCCVTSPPYFGLRDYGHDGQIGLEESPDAFVQQMVGVFRDVKRVLRDDGTLWLNLGDSYAGSGKGRNGDGSVHPSALNAKQGTSKGTTEGNLKPCRTFRAGAGRADGVVDERAQRNRDGLGPIDGMKPKDLIGIPWRVAFALQADGWYLRQDIIWHKPNPMPESVTDRCTKAHEYIFLLSKSARYFYDAEAIQEGATLRGTTETGDLSYSDGASRNDNSPSSRLRIDRDSRNRRSVWSVTTKGYKGAHFATFPPDLIRPCILAGCPTGGTVLDPFGGSGTTGQVAMEEGRKAILCELNADYVGLIRKRIDGVTPSLFGRAA
jgi:site-specific DNA-methyltransferase (adenine-specific)